MYKTYLGIIKYLCSMANNKYFKRKNYRQEIFYLCNFKSYIFAYSFIYYLSHANYRYIIFYRFSV